MRPAPAPPPRTEWQGVVGKKPVPTRTSTGPCSVPRTPGRAPNVQCAVPVALDLSTCSRTTPDHACALDAAKAHGGASPGCSQESPRPPVVAQGGQPQSTHGAFRNDQQTRGTADVAGARTVRRQRTWRPLALRWSSRPEGQHPASSTHGLCGKDPDAYANGEEHLRQNPRRCQRRP